MPPKVREISLTQIVCAAERTCCLCIAEYIVVIASVEKCAAINKEKADSVHQRMMSVKLLSLGLGRSRGQVAKIVIFAAIGDGFQVFGVPSVGDADT